MGLTVPRTLRPFSRLCEHRFLASVISFLCLRVAVTSDRKLGDLKQQALFLSQVWRPEGPNQPHRAHVQVWAGLGGPVHASSGLPCRRRSVACGQVASVVPVCAGVKHSSATLVEG